MHFCSKVALISAWFYVTNSIAGCIVAFKAKRIARSDAKLEQTEKEDLARGGTENRPPSLSSSCVWDHPSSGKNQGKLRTNQLQLTPAQGYKRKRKFRVPRFVVDNQAVVLPKSCPHQPPITHTTPSHLAQALLRRCSGNDQRNCQMQLRWVGNTLQF